MTVFVVGGLAIRVVAPPAVSDAVLVRHGAFVDEQRAPDVTLHVEARGGFMADYRLDAPEAALRIATAREGDRVVVTGGARGWFDPERSTGVLHGATHLGEVDALLRLALALALPRRGALLLHGTAVPASGVPAAGESREDGATTGAVAVLVGASGAGKSTAAAALGASLGDELVVLHPPDEVRGAEASATPYWRGRPGRHAVSTIACLSRGEASGVTALSGSAALRALAPHVVRYVFDDATDRFIFALLAATCARVPVTRLACPDGAAFVPFLRAALGEHAGAR